MRHLVDPYLEFHETAWAPTTYASAKSQLRTLGEKIELTPEALHKEVSKHMKPYSIKTLFIRLCTLEKWANQQGLLKSRPFETFMAKHRNRFKHAYQPESIEINYAEAERRIETLNDSRIRNALMGLCKSGARISEIYTLNDGRVVGKGGKIRNVFGAIKPEVSQSSLRQALKSLGMKPHQLRKLCATRLVEKGATPADLCKIFGWSNIQTAYSYCQSKDDARLEALLAD